MKIGIDFGSTYSTVAKYDSDSNTVEAITFAEGEPASIPSVVSISKKGVVTCGTGAKSQMGKKTVRIFDAFKMLLTETNQEMLQRRGYDSEYSPRVIAKHFLESLLKGAIGRGETKKTFENIVICVPEIWGKNLNTLDGRVILRDILKNDIDIPVNHIQVVTEPEAASAFIAYNYEKEAKKSFNGHLLLVDYGGGTLDLTLTEVTSDGKGGMEIAYREGGGAGENHPDAQGNGNIGSAGIAYMQNVVLRALRDAKLLEENEIPDYTSPDYIATVRDLESQLKSPERIKDIEDVFDEFGSYHKLQKILKEDPIDFVSLEYNEEEVPVTYQHLYQAYTEVIEKVLNDQITQINEQVKVHIGADPCDPNSGSEDTFKIALVGGFGSFYLVKKQLSDIYKLDFNSEIDQRTKNVSADKREQAISLGAALVAAGKIILRKTARYSIGVYASGSDARARLFYGIKYHQTVEPGKPYFICYDEDAPDEPKNRVTYGALHGNIRIFAIEFTDRRDHGGLMNLKSEILQRMQQLPQEGFWNLGFSMDESDVISFHIVPRPIPGFPAGNKGIVIPLDSYTRMFDLTAVREVTV